MATVVIRHKVGDIDAWIKGHQERLDLFTPALTSDKSFQDVDDRNSVILIFETANLDLLTAIPQNQALKGKHTVLEPVTVLREISF